MYRHEQDSGGSGEGEEGRERQMMVLRKALREVLGPLYAPREREGGGSRRERERGLRTLSDEEDGFESKEEV